MREWPLTATQGAKQAYGDGTCPLPEGQNDAFIKERFDNLGKLKAKTPVVENRQAFLDGYRKGKEVDIYEGIDKSRDKPKPIG